MNSNLLLFIPQSFIDSRFTFDPIICKYRIICALTLLHFHHQLVLFVVSFSFRGSLSVSRRGSVGNIFPVSLISDFSHLSQIATNILQTFHLVGFCSIYYLLACFLGFPLRLWHSVVINIHSQQKLKSSLSEVSSLYNILPFDHLCKFCSS